MEGIKFLNFHKFWDFFAVFFQECAWNYAHEGRLQGRFLHPGSVQSAFREHPKNDSPLFQVQTTHQGSRAYVPPPPYPGRTPVTS